MDEFEAIITSNYTVGQENDSELAAYQGAAGNAMRHTLASIVAEVAMPRLLANIDLYRVQR